MDNALPFLRGRYYESYSEHNDRTCGQKPFFSSEFESAYTVWIPSAVSDHFFCIWDLPAVVLCLPVVPRMEPSTGHGRNAVRWF
ncbi:hypothetical protein VCRA2116O33_60232 [Vibrio crassostreae]|nr:hypothetical protein VCRA2116O33_60232 [Vibrio crassostreae]